MKVAILMSTYNKSDILYNVLKSISIQKTSFPFYLVVVDDASTCEEKVEDILNFFDIPYKFIQLTINVGFSHALSKCLSLVSEDTDILVLQSADVLYSDENTLETLVKGVSEKTFTLAEVRNVKIPVDLWKQWDSIDYYLEEERRFEISSEIVHQSLIGTYIPPAEKEETPLPELVELYWEDRKFIYHYEIKGYKVIESRGTKLPYGKHKKLILRLIKEVPKENNLHIYWNLLSGKRAYLPEERWYFFLGAILKKDLERTCFKNLCFDEALSKSLHSIDMKVNYVNCLALHQHHERLTEKNAEEYVLLKKMKEEGLW